VTNLRRPSQLCDLVAANSTMRKADCCAQSGTIQSYDRRCRAQNLRLDSGCPASMSGGSWPTAFPGCGTLICGPGLLNRGVTGCGG
jgi:hypothetical protein